jgi:hydroxymethylglutaryl-CoA synthase
MTTTVGIEAVHVYPASLVVSMDDLARARGMDPKYVADDLMTVERSMNPLWEDTVTLAVNAARPLVERVGADSIGFVIVSTESGVDQEKPISSWVHRYLGLPPTCRNLEVKYACYGATGALHLLLAWLQSDLSRGKKALLINADQSLLSIGVPYEPIGGAGAVAVLLSAEPRLLAYETDRGGVFAQELTDVFRPTPRVEMGNGELSLLTYLDSLEQAFADYLRAAPEAANVDSYFDWHVYHMPFPGMAYQAHRSLLGQYCDFSRKETRAHFARKCEPSVVLLRRTGACYGGSTFVGLVSLAARDEPISGRVGIYVYGSGSSAEFLSGQFVPGAERVARDAGLAAALDHRRPVTIAEYEKIERVRDASVMAKDFAPDLQTCGDWYEQAYAGQGKLVLERIDGYYRHYRWS